MLQRELSSRWHPEATGGAALDADARMVGVPPTDSQVLCGPVRHDKRRGQEAMALAEQRMPLPLYVCHAPPPPPPEPSSEARHDGVFARRAYVGS